MGNEVQEELERKQTELDEARAFLRAHGVSGFGSLKDGIAQHTHELEEAAPRKPRLMVMELSSDDVLKISARIRREAERLENDATYRVTVPFRMEVLSLALRLYQQLTETDSEEVVRAIHGQLLNALKDAMDQLKEESV